MKEWRKTKSYKIIRNSGYTFKQICKTIQHYNANEIKCYATKESESRHLIESIEKAIKTLNNNQNNPVGHLNIKFKIGQNAYYIDCVKSRIIIRQTKILGFGVKCPELDNDILYLCDLFDFDDKKIFYDDELFHSVDDAKKRIKESQIIIDVIDRFGVVIKPKNSA